MLRSLFLTLIYLGFLGCGLTAPFAATLGYVWVDTFRPQAIAFIILNQIPVALIMGAAAVGTYFVFDRKSPPRFTVITALTLLMAFWATMTLLWAEVPDAAWEKWDWAFKTIVFSAFVPWVIRSRVQIEAFVQTLVLSLAATLIPFGLKVSISGGGYGRSLGLVAGNAGLSEGATLAAIAVMTIPLCMYLRKNTIIIPHKFGFNNIYLFFIGCAVATTVGTYERTGLVGLIVVAGYMFLQSRRKLVFGITAVAIGVIIAVAASQAWHERIDTLNDPLKEGSAYTRILVWQWTLNYAMSHPLGGGFNSFLIDFIEVPGGGTIAHRAFHSVYFEVLGEQGWVGLAIFLGLVVSSYFALRRTRRMVAGHPELAWCGELASALQVMLAVLMTCGTFIGIAFQPWLYYAFAMSVSVSQYARRVLAAPIVTRAGGAVQFSAHVVPPAAPTPATPAAIPWRARASTVAGVTPRGEGSLRS